MEKVYDNNSANDYICPLKQLLATAWFAVTTAFLPLTTVIDLAIIDTYFFIFVFNFNCCTERETERQRDRETATDRHRETEKGKERRDRQREIF